MSATNDGGPDEFKKLLTEFSNKSFNCGEFKFPDGAGISPEYNATCDRVLILKQQITAMYLAARSPSTGGGEKV